MKADPRAEGYENRTYDYIDVVQWRNGDAQRRATLRPAFGELEKKLWRPHLRPFEKRVARPGERLESGAKRLHFPRLCL